MSRFFNNIVLALKNHKNVVIIIAAAILVELFSAVQYYSARDLLEEELDHRAESELRIKAILVKSMLNMIENTLDEHFWDINRNIAHADSMFEVTARIIQNTPEAVGSCLAFVPNFYPEKGRLFEPYAYKEKGKIVVEQLGGKGDHDYTKHPAYLKVTKEMVPFWSDPYDYESESSIMSLTTYSYPLKDKGGKLVAVCGIDLSLEQIGDTLNARHIYPSSFDLLLTDSGEIISGPSVNHPKAYDMKQVIRLINDKKAKCKNSRSGLSEYIVFNSETDGARAYIYYANIVGNPHWQVAVVCYNDEVYGDLRKMRLKVFLFMLLGFALLGFIIHRFVRNERNLNRARMEQERIGSELRIAQNIQTEMLPKKFPPYPDRNDLQIYGKLVPAKEVGGDIYDFFLRDEKLFFCIGDVSGKGIPSAIIMAEIHSQFRMATVHEKNPAQLMQKLNIALCEGNESNIFVTLFIGLLDLPTGRLRYCNAGHEIPFILSSNEKDVSTLPVKANIPIGLFNDFQYEMQETNISHNTTIFLYTDGLTEAKNNARKQFGIKRVEKTLSDYVLSSPEEIIKEIDGQVHLFVENAEQSDDLTLLAIKYTPHNYIYIGSEEVMLKNEVQYVNDLNAFVETITDKLKIEKSQARKIKLAVEEVVVNVIEYAYPKGTSGDICVKAMFNDQELKFIISDSGVAFDPTLTELADTSLSLEERPIGGLGLLLVRKTMDSINYERINNKNILTLFIHYNTK